MAVLEMLRPYRPLILELGGILVMIAAAVAFVPLPMWAFGLSAAIAIGLLMIAVGLKLEGGDR